MNTLYNPIIVSSFSRSHSSGSLNYLLIEEQIIIKTSRTTGIKFTNGRQIPAEQYELDGITESSVQSTKFTKDSMVDNIATEDYKYFRIVFANGVEIICSSYGEFETIYNEMNKGA